MFISIFLYPPLTQTIFFYPSSSVLKYCLFRLTSILDKWELTSSLCIKEAVNMNSSYKDFLSKLLPHHFLSHSFWKNITFFIQNIWWRERKQKAENIIFRNSPFLKCKKVKTLLLRLQVTNDDKAVPRRPGRGASFFFGGGGVGFFRLTLWLSLGVLHSALNQ